MKGKPVELILRKHSVDEPLSVKLGPSFTVEQLRPELTELLNDSAEILEQMIRIDLEHSWGYAEQLNERLERLNGMRELLEMHGPATPKEPQDYPPGEQGGYGER